MMDQMRIILSTVTIKDNKLSLKDVLCDTYAFPDNADVSHGRLRFYDGNQIETKGDSGYFGETNVTGSSPDPITFMEMQGDFELKYNVKSMDWTISMKDSNYITRNVIGKLTGQFDDLPIRFKMKNARILYSTMITLINVNLEIPKIT